MENFKKLSRGEMRNVLGGTNNGCPGGGCLLPMNCINLGSFCQAGPQQSGTCIACTCPGQSGLQCNPNA